MSIKVLVNGAFGRMGQITVKAISAQPTLELVGQTGREYDLKKQLKIVMQKSSLILRILTPSLPIPPSLSKQAHILSLVPPV